MVRTLLIMPASYIISSVAQDVPPTWWVTGVVRDRKGIFSLVEGTEWAAKKSLTSLRFDSHVAPLVVIFTKRDGAVAKVTQSIKESSSSLEGTFSRAAKKQARATADIEVTKRVKKREEELRQLSQTNSAIMFLTTSGMVTWRSPIERHWLLYQDMEQATAQSLEACENLIKATEEALTGPRIKTLLSLVWGHNLSRCGFWCFYWCWSVSSMNTL